MYIEKKLCVPNTVECKSRSRYIQTAESLDIDYDASSGELLVKAYQGRSSTPAVGWSTRESALENGRTEIGLLATQDATEKDHLKLGGYLVVLREEKKLSIIFTYHILSILIMQSQPYFNFRHDIILRHLSTQHIRSRLRNHMGSIRLCKSRLIQARFIDHEQLIQIPALYMLI